MAPPPSRATSPGPASGEVGITMGSPAIDPGHGFVAADLDFYDSSPNRLTGEMWDLFFHCKGAPPDREFIRLELDRADVSFYNLICIKSKFGYSGRDFLYYKKRCGRDVAILESIDFDHNAQSMIENNATERKVRFLLSKDQPTEMQVSITPMKRPRERRNSCEPCIDETIDAYKDWLANLQEEQPETEFKDDYRDETIKTYQEWLRQQRKLTDIVSFLQPTNDVGTLPDDDNHDDNPPTTQWPSHARRPKQQGNGGAKKGGRGTLKGLSAATKRIKSGSHKLEIEFSPRLGGPIGPNSRSFVDEVVMFTRKRAPLIGVKSWKDIKQNVKNSIASDVLSRWTFKDTENPNEKIWAVAKDRYKGWRSTFSSTYKAYHTYAERMKKKPEDVDIVEWHYLMLYFGTEKFQKASNQNSGNRQQQKTKHVMGSKPFSQYSFEQRNSDTGEEPDDLTLWMNTHMKDGKWSNSASKEVYDNANSKICETELQQERFLSREEENIIFQSTYKESTRCKTSRLHGHGYLAKYPTRRQLMDAQLQEQVRASAAARQKNVQLEDKVQRLEEQLANEVAERDRIVEESRRQIQEEEEKARNAFREALRQELREEMLSIIADQREEISNQNQETNIASELAATPTQPTNVRKTRISNVNKSLFQNNSANGSATFISSHHLRSAAKYRARSRSEQHEETS